MNILIVTPAPAGSRQGNRVTALRWAKLLRQLGHRVHIREQYEGERAGLLIALHARRSFLAMQLFRKAYPALPMVVALTGTDLYQDIHHDPDARLSLELATRLVVLQQQGVDELPGRFRSKTRVIYQSCKPPARCPRPRSDFFDVCVLGHLRPVKDPFRTARATRFLPKSSRIRVLHLGAALTPDMAKQARAEMARNPRYHWLGGLPRWRAIRILAGSRLLVLTSIMEGGANAVSEALAVGRPVLSSEIAGSIGMLGEKYPGFFPAGNTRALAALLLRAETDSEFYNALRVWCRKLRPLVRPARERLAWRSLLGELRPHE
jgi:putative glycosyltransferase (TIGR04348 family)